jgi:hypothetical protein
MLDEANSKLSIHKYQATSHIIDSPRQPGSRNLCAPDECYSFTQSVCPERTVTAEAPHHISSLSPYFHIQQPLRLEQRSSDMCHRSLIKIFHYNFQFILTTS